jgi:hypothetical protein
MGKTLQDINEEISDIMGGSDRVWQIKTKIFMENIYYLIL